MFNSKIYFPNLNGLRFIAALAVIIYHVYGLETLNGHLGVILFFALSGFLITTLLLEEKEVTSTVNIKFFFIRRCLRIWPLYFLIVLITFLLVGIIFQGYSLSTYKGNFWYYLIFIPNVAFIINAALPYASILWSVGSEEQFYVTWPFLVKYTGVYFWVVLIVVLVGFTALPNVLDYLNFHRYGGKNEVMAFISHLMVRMAFNCMATGALTAYIWRKRPGLFRYIFSVPAQVVVILLTLLLWIKNYHKMGSDEVFAILFSLIIANAALNPANILKLENAVFKHLGKISYGLYVYHLLVLAVVTYAAVEITGSPLGKHALFATGTLATIGVATVSYNYFEKFFLKIKNLRFTVIKSGDAA